MSTITPSQGSWYTQGEMKAWQQEEVFHDGDPFFDHLIRDISYAKISITLETYIFDRDVLGKRIIQSLKKAVDRGVEVRLMIDGVGSSHWSHSHFEELRAEGIQVKVFNPLPWQITRLNFILQFATSQWLSKLWKLNRRNHRKTCLIDGRIAYLGGMNISSRHSKRIQAKKAWRDTGARVSGTPLRDLAQAFEAAWNPKPFTKKWKFKFRRLARLPLSRLVRLNHTRAKRRRNYKDLIRRIRKCKDRVWITNPYFVPKFSFVRALRRAARSGADVRILVPGQSDLFFMKWFSKIYYPFLLRVGVRIFEYFPQMLHAKIMMLDDWATVGSSNLNHRSLLHDLEVDIVLTKEESLRSLEEQYQKDLRQSKEALISHLRKKSWYMYWVDRILLKLRYWV